MLIPRINHKTKKLFLGSNKGNIHSLVNYGKLIEFFEQNKTFFKLLQSGYSLSLIEYAEAREFTLSDFQHTVNNALDVLPIDKFYHITVLSNSSYVFHNAKHLCNDKYHLSGGDFYMKWRFQRSGDFLNLFSPFFPNKFDYKFLFLNRAFRLGRNLFYSRVKNEIGFNNFLFSNPTYISPGRKNKIDNKHNGDLVSFIRSLLNPKYSSLAEEINSSLNYNLTSNIPPIQNRTSEETWPQEDFYKYTFCEVLSETFSDNGIHTNYTDNMGIILSEKIFKPLLACRPFLVNGNPYTLKHLKKLGFKTFNKYWDEGYDTILDINQRHSSILNIIKEINKKSDTELKSILLDMKNILLFNREHALNFLAEDIYFSN